MASRSKNRAGSSCAATPRKLVPSQVLGREALRRYFTVDEAAEFVGAVAGASDEVADPAMVEAVSRDPDDDHLVALARDAALTAS